MNNVPTQTPKPKALWRFFAVLPPCCSAVLFAFAPVGNTQDNDTQDENLALEENQPTGDHPNSTNDVLILSDSVGERQKLSAHAVTVVALDRAKVESSDIGQVLARVEGVSIQRTGGLGSDGRLSLGGFDEGQVRVFVDGIPIQLMGYSFGLQNLPLNLAKRIDIYKGVVPLRLGTDALGGALDIITDHSTTGTQAYASLQTGAFETHRLTASLRHLHEDSGLFGKVEGFLDTTRNNYEVDVDTTGPQGQVIPATVYRFHDSYQAKGSNLEVGFVRKPWAHRLLARAFITDFHKDHQHNASMTTSYGEATYGGLFAGGNVRYEHHFGEGFGVDVVSGYAFNRNDWKDLGRCVYDWHGRCVFERATPGEVSVGPSDRSLWAHTYYGRWNGLWTPTAEHTLRLTAAPTYFHRTGKERAIQEGALDHLSGERKLITWVSGLEHEAYLFNDRLQNVASIKNYSLTARSRQPLVGDVNQNIDTSSNHWGAHNSTRIQLTEPLYIKASYEYAIRQPEPEEMFGNGTHILENIHLAPERSHNANLSLLAQETKIGFGKLRGNTAGFFRQASDLVVLLGRDGFFQHRNVGKVRVRGVEANLSWTSPKRYLELSANGTYQDVRNISSTGAFALFEGDRLPNRPHLFANASARLSLNNIQAPQDELAFTWYGRYVHEFFKNWESIGAVETKATVASQFTQSIVVSYVTSKGLLEQLTFSAEVQNLTNEKTFDYFGVQKPGRATYFKMTLTL